METTIKRITDEQLKVFSELLIPDEISRYIVAKRQEPLNAIQEHRVLLRRTSSDGTDVDIELTVQVSPSDQNTPSERLTDLKVSISMADVEKNFYPAFPIQCRTWDEVEKIKQLYCKPIGKGPKGQPCYDLDEVSKFVIFPKD